jgi:hypothetical protein
MSAVATVEAPQGARVVEVKGAGRHYLCQDGVLRPSVTTILDCVGKPALIPWAANQERALVIEAASALYAKLLGESALEKPAYVAALTEVLGTTKAHTRELAKAAEIGTQTHKHIEWVLRKDLGQVVPASPPPLSPKALLAYQVFDGWRDRVRLIPQRIEQQVWSRTHDYAGTLDLLASITLDGVRCTAVLDWKSGKAIYPEALLQNAAYVAALAEMGHVTGPVHGVIVRLPKVGSDPEPEMRIIPPEDQAALFDVFLSVKRLWNWLQGQERQRQEARTRPVPAPVITEPWRAPLLAEIADAKAQLARQPSDGQWATILRHVCGVDDVATAQEHQLRRVLGVTRDLVKKDPTAIRRVKDAFAVAEVLKPAAPTTATTTAVTQAETRQDGGSYPNRPGAASITESDTPGRHQGDTGNAGLAGVGGPDAREDSAPRADDPGAVSSPAAAAMLVGEDDPRETMLASINDAKRRIERQPPADVWQRIVVAVCRTEDLLKAEPATLDALRQLVEGLATQDRMAISRVRAILAGSR